MGQRDISKLLAEVAEIEEENAHEERQHFRNQRPAKSPSQVYSIRIPVDRLEELRRTAHRMEVAPSVLMRKWVLERLDAEVGASVPKRLHVDYTSRSGRQTRVFVAKYGAGAPGVIDKLRPREMAS